MSRISNVKLESSTWAPLISLFIILFFLFSVVFLQMESRRLSYQVFRLSRELKSIEDHYRLNRMQYSRLLQPERVHRVAQNFRFLNTVRKNQIIHMSGERVAVRQ